MFALKNKDGLPIKNHNGDAVVVATKEGALQMAKLYAAQRGHEVIVHDPEPVDLEAIIDDASVKVVA